MRRLSKHWLITLATSLVIMNVQAQYLGGDGDGFVSTTILQLDISGVPVGLRSLYVGGQGDGYTEAASLTSPGGADLTTLYAGGQGDGFDQQAASFALEGTNLVGLFTGGNGDGFDLNDYTASLGGQTVTGLFSGGDGDGFDLDDYTASLEGQTVAGLFSGGDGDGFDVQLFAGDLMGEMLILYSGGDGDGFDHNQVSFSLDGESLAGLYGGGNGDGFDTETFEGIVPLPLTLITFEAIPEETFVLLRWVTEDESGTDFFTIEKTRDGFGFDFVAETAAAGFSEPGERLHYTTRDERPWDGTSFYRLKTTDFDGEVALSHLVEVNYSRAAEGHSFDLFPNPNTGKHFSLRLHGYSPAHRVTYTIIGVNGQQIATGQFFPEEEAVRFQLPQKLSPGSYLIQLRSEDGKSDTKILLVGK